MLLEDTGQASVGLLVIMPELPIVPARAREGRSPVSCRRVSTLDG